MSWGSFRVWLAIILLLDVSFGLWNHERLRQMVPNTNIFKIAWVEAGVAVILLMVHFLF